VFEDLATLRRRRSSKWVEHPADVLPAFVAEMDVALAPPVRDALIEAIELGDVGYAEPGGARALCCATRTTRPAACSSARVSRRSRSSPSATARS